MPRRPSRLRTTQTRSPSSWPRTPSTPSRLRTTDRTRLRSSSPRISKTADLPDSSSEDLNNAQRAEESRSSETLPRERVAERSEPPSDMNLLRERAEKLYKMEAGRARRPGRATISTRSSRTGDIIILLRRPAETEPGGKFPGQARPAGRVGRNRHDASHLTGESLRRAREAPRT